MSDLLQKVVAVYAEDEEMVRTQVSRFLSHRVKMIYEASNGLEGLELIKEHKPNLIITDLEMPVMNGLEMIQHVREHYGEKLPILVLTGYSDDEHYTDLADAFLYKPINLRELVDVIEKLLQR